MSTNESPNVETNETNVQNNLSTQSGYPNMSTEKTFIVQNGLLVEGDAVVTGTVTATSFIGDGSQLTGISGGTGGGLDSADVTLLVDSDYVQARVTLDGVGLDSAGVTALVDSDYVAARAPAGGGGLDSDGVLDLLSYGIAEVGSNQKQVAISLNTFVSPTNLMAGDSRGLSLNYTGSTGFSIGEVSSVTVVEADASGSGGTVGIVLKGVTASHTGTEIQGNLRLSSLPTSDPSEAGLLWNDGGIPVFSGSTAPTGGGGGLDSASVNDMIDSDLAGAESPNSYTMKIGANASRIAIGSGAVSERVNSMSIGSNAGRYVTGGTGHIIIGDQAGGAAAGGGGQAHNIVAVGTNASTDLSGTQYETVAIGYNAGRTNMGNYAVAIGSGASTSSAGDQTVALGYSASATGYRALAIGASASASTNFAIDIRTSDDGSLTYDTTNDWTFGAGVTMTDLTASGATVIFSNLPTVNPLNAGQLWIDGETLKVSAG